MKAQTLSLVVLVCVSSAVASQGKRQTSRKESAKPPARAVAPEQGGGKKLSAPMSAEVVKRKIITVCRREGFSDAETRFCLAVAEQESGFNPNARNRGSTAAGIFQFVEATWKARCKEAGLSPLTSPHDVDAQLRCFLPHFRAMQHWARQKVGSRAGPDEFFAWCYKFHHDGPAGEYGGLRLGRKSVVPKMKRFKL